MALDLSLLDQDVVQGHATAVVATAPRASLDAFEVDPDNPRFEDDVAAFDRLVEDIRTRGILQPIIARRTAQGKLRIRFGERRYLAAVALHLPEVPYLVTEDERQFDDYAQIAENEQRHGLQPLELATFVAKRLAAGETRRAIASKLHLDPSAVTQLIALTGEVPPLILELYHSRRCRTPLYLYELRKLHEQQPELVQTMCAAPVMIDRALVDRIVCEVRAVGSASASNVNVACEVVLEHELRHDALEMEDGAPVSDLPRRATAGEGSVLPRTPTASAAPQRYRAQLFGVIDGRSVTLELAVRPTAPHRLHVRYEDGSVAEVPIKSIQLTDVRDGR